MSILGSAQKLQPILHSNQQSNQNMSTLQNSKDDQNFSSLFDSYNVSHNVKSIPDSSQNIIQQRYETKREFQKQYSHNKSRERFTPKNNQRSIQKVISESSFLEENSIAGIGGLQYQDHQRVSFDNSYAEQSLIFHNQLNNSLVNSRKQSGIVKTFESKNQFVNKLGCEESFISKSGYSRGGVHSSHFQKTLADKDDELKSIQINKYYDSKFQLYGKSNYVPQTQRDPKIVWRTGFFQIIRYVNKFLFTIKKTMIFRRPHLLKEHQIQAIDDKAAKQFQEGYGQKQKKLTKIVRSNIKILRKIRIMSLLLKKSFKFVINPYQKFKNQLEKHLDQLSKSIPVIMPYSKISNCADFLHMLVIIFFLVTIPFEISFQYLSVDIITSYAYDVMRLVLFLQIILNFNTAFYDKGCIVIQKRKIMKRYLYKFFILDLLALLCLYDFFIGASFQKLFFFVKIKSLKEITYKFKEQFHMHEKTQVILQILTLFFQTFLLCHFFACTFYFIADWERSRGMHNWIQFYQNSETNVIKNGIISQYIVSLYFSVILIGTIGFGDYAPQSEIEMVYILFLGFIASGFFAYVLSQIGGIIREISKKEEKFKARLKELNRQILKYYEPAIFIRFLIPLIQQIFIFNEDKILLQNEQKIL